MRQRNVAKERNAKKEGDGICGSSSFKMCRKENVTQMPIIQPKRTWSNECKILKALFAPTIAANSNADATHLSYFPPYSIAKYIPIPVLMRLCPLGAPYSMGHFSSMTPLPKSASMNGLGLSYIILMPSLTTIRH